MGGFGVSFNLAFTFLGGSSSLLNVAIERSSPDVGPGVYWSSISFLSTISLIVGYYLRRSSNLPRYLSIRTEPEELKNAVPKDPRAKRIGGGQLEERPVAVVEIVV